MVKQFVLLLAGITAVGLLIKSKVNDWRAIMPQLKAFPTDFNRLNINFNKIEFYLEVTLFNPTKQAFNPDGIIAQLDRLEVTAKGQKIATIEVKKNGIQIPAEGKFVLKNLKVNVPVTSLLFVKDIKTYDDLDVVAIMNVLGEEYSI